MTGVPETDTWHWYCDLCGVRSFATFDTLEEARQMRLVHEKNCGQPVTWKMALT